MDVRREKEPNATLEFMVAGLDDLVSVPEPTFAQPLIKDLALIDFNQIVESLTAELNQKPSQRLVSGVKSVFRGRAV